MFSIRIGERRFFIVFRQTYFVALERHYQTGVFEGKNCVPPKNQGVFCVFFFRIPVLYNRSGRSFPNIILDYSKLK